MSSSDGPLPDGSPPSPPPGIAPDDPALPAVLLGRVSDGVLALGADGRVSYVNAAALGALGRAELTGAALGGEAPDGLASRLGGACREAALRAGVLPLEASLELFSEARGRWFECRVFPGAGGSTVLLRDVTERRAARRRLEENEQRSRSLFEQNVDAVFSFDLAGRFTEANAACLLVSGYSPEELRGTSFLPLVVPEDRERVRGVFQRAVEGTPQHEEVTILHKSGRRVEVGIAKVPIVVDGVVVGVYGIAKDVTARKGAEAALRQSESWLRAVAEAGPVAMTITRWGDGTIFYANRHVRDLFRVPPGEEIVGQSTERFFASPGDRARLIGALAERGHVLNWESEARRADGTTFWASGAFQRMVYRGEDALYSVYRDVSIARLLLDEARAEAERDPLTGLLNRRAFQLRLELEADKARRCGGALAVAVFDLDNFKFFNDAYTHAVGDDVLRLVASALRAACRAGDSLARLGGDEFALLMPQADGAGANGARADGPAATADGVRARLMAGVGELGLRPPGLGAPLPIGLSVGVALFPAEAPTPQEALWVADERLLRAKAGAGEGGAEASRVRAALRDGAEGFAILDALVTAVDARDRYTRRHSEDVLAHGLRLARALGLAGEDLRAAGAAALLLDVGKIGVPDRILRKPGGLTAEERAAVRLHPLMGSALVTSVPGFGPLAGAVGGAVRSHHERWDGAGYPDGLASEATPLLARLLSVADAYAALTADRPYRKAFGAAQARRLLGEGAGSQWDPACVAAFLADPSAEEDAA